MATIQKRGDSYKITVSCGYDLNGKQIRRTTTWTPENGMSARQVKKELDRQAVLFEEKCRNGQVLDGNITLADFIDRWFRDYAEQQLRPTTIAGYRKLLKRTLPAIGHIRLSKLKPHHLMQFYANLAEPGIREAGSLQCLPRLALTMEGQQLTAADLARETGLTPSRISLVVHRHGVSAQTAQKIADVLGQSVKSLFQPARNDKPLSGNSIQHYHRFLSSVLSTAVKWQVIFSNPCERVDPPKIAKKEAHYLDEEQAARLLALLENEDIQNRTMIKLLLFTGMRRGELCGLCWTDIDFENAVIEISRSSLYIPGKGVFTDGTKNESSARVIKIPNDAVLMLRTFRAWQMEQRLKCGDQWQNSGRVFTSWNGAPIHPDSITGWFARFVKRHDLPPITVHSLRHSYAVASLRAGDDIKTVQSNLGHHAAAFTLDVYGHVTDDMKKASAERMEKFIERISKP